MSNKIYFNEEARAKLKKGIDIAYRAVAVTLGAAGRNSIYRSFYSKAPMGTNDGISILREINLDDDISQMGVDMIKQSSSRTNDQAGDGTSTAVVLSKAMVDKGLDLIKDKGFLFWKKKGENPMILRKQIGQAIKDITDRLKDKSRKIETDEDVFNIANISMENPEIAKIVVEAVKKAGEHGVVLVEESTGLDIKKEEIEGLKFDKGYITPYMASNPMTMEGILTDTHILVTDKSMQVNSDLFPVLEELHKQDVKKLLIICENITGELLISLINNRMANKFYCIAVQKPNDADILEDIAILTGGQTILNEKFPNGLKAEHCTYLGKADKVVVTKDSTSIIGGQGSKEKIEERIKLIKKEIDDSTGYKKEMIKERLAKLVGGVVIIKVGAPTEAEMKYLKLKVDDAVASTRSAIEEGIVIGGGKALYELSLEKPKNAGEEVVFYACKQPIKQIIKNAGFNPKKILKNLKEGQVWNALTNSIVEDPFKFGLIDPTKVERCALENSASFAGLFLTTSSVIVENNEIDKNS